MTIMMKKLIEFDIKCSVVILTSCSTIQKKFTFLRTMDVAVVVVLLATVVETSGVAVVVGTSLCIACCSFGFVGLSSVGCTTRLGTNCWSKCQPCPYFQAKIKTKYS